MSVGVMEDYKLRDLRASHTGLVRVAFFHTNKSITQKTEGYVGTYFSTFEGKSANTNLLVVYYQYVLVNYQFVIGTFTFQLYN
jgi:hypothetical protein